MDVKGFLAGVRSSDHYCDQIVCVREIPARPARYKDLKEPLPEAIVRAMEAQGITGLYHHQATAVETARKNQDFIVVTGTASGKTLCYNLPVLERMLSDPLVRALYIYPTKALAQDQLRGLLRWSEVCPELGLRPGTYDGDTPQDERQTLRAEANCILTNPDMLHAAILPHHPGWCDFFSNLAYVIIDEVHTYRGIFGSNVANVIRRLLRICRHYGSEPRFMCASATIANPGELAGRLIGKDVVQIDEDGSPRGTKHFVLWNPAPSRKSVGRRSASMEARELLVQLIKKRIRTIIFTRARVVAELIFRYAREELQRVGPSLADSIRVYRGGYLPEKRRAIERELFSGKLLGVASTNALELGIDVGSLDACIMVGFPGTIASTWQQAGRAGRGDDESLAVLIAHNNPIDQYLVQHPDYFFARSAENAVVDPDNPYIVLRHLRAAAFEMPVTIEEEKAFGRYAPALLDILAEDGQVVLQGDRWYWKHKGYPADDFNLRNMSDNTYTIIDCTDEKNQVIGSIDELSAFTQLYPEAIYIHGGETFYVSDLNLEHKAAYVKRAETDYYTQAITDRQVRIEGEDRSREWRTSRLGFGEVGVTFITYMFKKIKFYSNDSIGFGKISLPQSTLETCSLWLMPALDALRLVRGFGRNPLEGLLGIANVMIEVIPLFAMCDQADIGSAVDASNTDIPAIFIFDRYPGGIGFAEKAYELIEDIMRACLDLIKGCDCRTGCPSCVGSPIPPYSQTNPQNTAGGAIPDKEGALVVLHHMLQLPVYTPQVSLQERDGLAEAAAGVDRPPAEPLPENLERRIRRQVQTLRNLRAQG